MGAIQLSYSTFGLTRLDLHQAIRAVDQAGYAGVELAFHRDQFNPFDFGDDELDALRQHLARLRVVPACIATASHFFDPQRPHEPSLLALEPAARKRRIDLVKRGIHVAHKLGVNLVSFGSGFLRDEHAAHPHVDAFALLVDAIHACLAAIGSEEDITLLIEPEPGMLIETLAQGRALIAAVGSPKFALHVDVCHAYCSEPDYLGALAEAAPHARYLHVSDARAGWNLTIAHDAPSLGFDLAARSTLVHFPDTADYLLVDAAHPIHFRAAHPSPSRQARVAELLAQAGIAQAPRVVAYDQLYAGASPLDDEIFTWAISVPGLSYDVLARAKPVVAYLRGAKGPPLVTAMLANTRTGIAHFHEIPGRGTLDFAASFKALAGHGFRGHATVELYHHVDGWQAALAESYRQLAPLVAAT